MSDTPETDSRVIRQDPRMCGCGYESEIIYADFARRLERERDAERALADRLAGDLNDLWHHYSQTEASYEVIEVALAAWKEARGEC